MDAFLTTWQRIPTSVLPFTGLFLKRFVTHYSTVKKDEWIKPHEDLEETLNVYEEAGFPGCVGSVDCVHVWWDRCPVNYTNVCCGKEKYPTLNSICPLLFLRSSAVNVPFQNRRVKEIF